MKQPDERQLPVVEYRDARRRTGPTGEEVLLGTLVLVCALLFALTAVGSVAGLFILPRYRETVGWRVALLMAVVFSAMAAFAGKFGTELLQGAPRE